MLRQVVSPHTYTYTGLSWVRQNRAIFAIAIANFHHRPGITAISSRIQRFLNKETLRF